MKPFNLESALAGNPVRLRNGAKAFVLADVSTLFKHCVADYPLKGAVSSVIGPNAYGCSDQWTKNGSNESEYFDIIGMWEEPELTQEQILEKAYSENLRITFDAAMFIDGYDVIGKTKDNEYIIEYGAVLRKIKPPIKGLAIYTPPPRQPMVTVTLPKPFKPEIGDYFYYIYSEPYSGTLKVTRRMFDQDDADATTQDGNRFRTLGDAQAWLDALKGAVDERMD